MVELALLLFKSTAPKPNTSSTTTIPPTINTIGERAGAAIIEVASAEELSDVISSMPFSGVTDVTIHALTTVEQSLKTIKQAEERIAQMAPAMGR